MTATPDPRLAELVARARVLLLDFDGPIARLFAGLPAPVIAEQLRDVIHAHGTDVPSPPPEDDGPIQILWRVADHGDPKLTRLIADRIRDAEVRAAATAAPTPGAVEVIRAAKATGRRVAIVSNNAAEAIRAYLDAHGFTELVDCVAARYDGMDPRLLKPDDHLLRLALKDLDSPATAALFVGDSVGDIEAGRVAGVPTIGYANKPGKRQALLDAGADVITDSMTFIADTVREA